MRSAALATALTLLTRTDHAGAAEIAVDQGDGTMCAGDFCFPAPPTPFVSSLSPAHGPLDGGTGVVVIGSGFRDFGELVGAIKASGELARWRLLFLPDEADLRRLPRACSFAPGHP